MILILGYGFWVSPDFKELAFGVAVFLFGMLALEDGFRSFTGGVLEKLLRRTTDSGVKCIAFGAGTTALVQSSGLISIITISFLSAGLLTLGQSLAITLGSTIGTTSGGFIIASLGLKMDIAALAMPLFVFGVLLIFQTGRNTRGLGYILSGLGFLFLGLHHIKAGFEFFHDKVDLIHHATGGFWGVVTFAGIGTLATVLMQSSHATMALVLTAALSGQTTLENGAAMIIGANVGTTSTGLFAAIGANEEGRRLAVAHFLFAALTALVVALGIVQILWLAQHASRLVGTGGDAALTLAFFHTFFNVVGALLIYPNLKRFEKFLLILIPPREERRSNFTHLNRASVDFPDTAVEAVRRELVAMYDDTVAILSGVLGYTPKQLSEGGDLAQLGEEAFGLDPFPVDETYREKVKERFAGIIEFISRANFTWHETQSQRIFWLRNAGRALAEAVKTGKHLQKNLLANSISSNPAERGLYRELRVEAAQLIASLEALRRTPDHGSVQAGLAQVREAVAHADNALLERIYSLIADKTITSEVGTSLINDHWYVSEMVNHLADALSTLYDSSSPRIPEDLAGNRRTRKPLAISG